MEKQQVQLTRTVFVDEIPEEVERIFRRSASSFSHSIGEPLIELTNLLEQKNYTVFLEKLREFREGLGRADMLLEDCNGIVRSYVSITSQPENQHQQEQGHHPNPQQQDLEKLLGNMGNALGKAEELQSKLGGKKDV